MRTPLLLALPLAAVGGAFMLARRLAVVEDLSWESVEKPGQLATVDGYRVHYEESGSGPAFVMIHGFGGSTYQYRHLMRAFADSHHCIALDLKGFGYSERAATAMSHTDQATMLAGFLEAKGITRATFIGHSMGGGVVQRFAAMYPDRARAIILAASVTGDERRGSRRIGGASSLMRPLLPLLAGLAGDRLFSASFHDRTRATPDLKEKYMRPARLRGSMDGLMRMMQDAANDGPIDYAKITMPTLILNASEDRVVPLGSAQKLQQRIPHATISVVERAGHLLFDERPDECIAAIRRFLEKPSEAPSAAPVATA